MSKRRVTNGDSESGIRPILGLALLMLIVSIVARIVIGGL